MWHVHNEYGAPLGDCYCDRCAAAFRRWLRRALRRPRRAERRRGAPRSGASATATGTRSSRRGARPDRGQPDPAAGLRALLLRRASCACFRAERDILHRLTPGRAGHHQLHGHQLQDHRLLGAGRPRSTWSSNDHYLRAEDPDNHIDLAMAADLTRSLAGGRAVAADGALHQRGQLAAAQHRQAARRDAPQQPRPRRPRRRLGAVLPVAGRPASARRSSTRRWCRTAGTDTRIWREVVALGADLAALAAAARHAGARPTSRSSGTGSPGGRWSWSGGRRSTCRFRERMDGVLRAAVARPRSPSTSSTRRPT